MVGGVFGPPPCPQCLPTSSLHFSQSPWLRKPVQGLDRILCAGSLDEALCSSKHCLLPCSRAFFLSRGHVTYYPFSHLKIPSLHHSSRKTPNRLLFETTSQESGGLRGEGRISPYKDCFQCYCYSSTLLGLHRLQLV